MKALAPLAMAFLIASCAKVTSAPMPNPPTSGPALTGAAMRSFLEKASDAEIRTRAVAQAQTDIRAGTPHVGWSGTIAVYRPNIPPDKEALVAGLPSLDLPAGCTDRLAGKGSIFASAYNGELVKHLPLAKKP
jgi:hypothetical protein